MIASLPFVPRGTFENVLQRRVVQGAEKKFSGDAT